MYIYILFIDKPGPPRAPLEPTETTNSSITLRWTKPEDDGGSELTGMLLFP